MIYMVYICAGLITLLFLLAGIGTGFFGAMLVATIIDWHRARKDSKNRVWEELKRTNYERRRPAAK
jgi:H+/Cl- antiporter ClcA